MEEDKSLPQLKQAFQVAHNFAENGGPLLTMISGTCALLSGGLTAAQYLAEAQHQQGLSFIEQLSSIPWGGVAFFAMTASTTVFFAMLGTACGKLAKELEVKISEREDQLPQPPQP